MSSYPANPLRLATVLILLTLLVACGGGGGSGGGTPVAGGGGTPMPMPVMLESLPGPLVANADQARQYVGGEAPPSLSSTRIEQTLNAITSDANTLLYDIVGVTSIACDGINCTYVDGNGFEVELTAGVLSSTEGIVGYNEQNTAVMTDDGITIGQRIGAGRYEDEEGEEFGNFQFQAYGGWNENNHFAIQRVRETIEDDMTTEVSTYSVGNATGTRPTTGSGRWIGTMVGLHTQEDYTVQGSASIRINSFAINALTILSLFEIKRLDTGGAVDNLDWTAVPIAADGTFASSVGDVRGTFYGADHEEIGGVFNRDNIIGAFGGTRVSQ